MRDDPPAGLQSYEALLAESPGDEVPATGLGGPMFYTSGTTGRPKGVVSGSFSGDDKPVELMMLVGQAIVGNLGMPEIGRTLLIGPVYHSAQWAFSFLPLLAGNAVVMRHGFDAEETLDLIDEFAITNIHLVPTQFVRMLRVDEDKRARFDGSSLQAVWHGAAPCSPDIKRAMIDWWGEKISEYYGSTESAIISTISSAEWLERPGSLGKPLAGIEVRVIKEDGSLAATGESGQLYFRNQMGTDFEYHKDPEKTKEAHLEPGVFSVGDIGYLDEDGYLFMSDRKIDMIISGGVNIYPAEIEGVLISHPAVADAAVFGIPNEEFGEEVKAAVELLAEYAPSDELAAELRGHCRDHLAGYKTPRSVDFEEELPRHPTGKLYKRLLRDRYWEGRDRKI
jgi:long-chain acyl-CoA synthetase